MRYSKDHKARTHERIVDSAAKLFRAKGFKATGVDAVMAEAGLTAGGFYGHFENKEDLFGQVMHHALETSPLRQGGEFANLGGAEFVSAIAGFYLSEQHRDRPDDGCPLPALTPEVARSSQKMRRRFEDGIMRWRDEIAERLDDSGLPLEERQEMALGVIATLVGGMTLARAFWTRDGVSSMLGAASKQATARVAPATRQASASALDTPRESDSDPASNDRN